MGMARVFIRMEVDQMIAEAMAKATAPLLERIAALEAELAKAKKNSSNSSKTPSSVLVEPPRPGQEREETKTRRPTGTLTTPAADFFAGSRQPNRTVHAGLLSRLRRFASACQASA